MHIFLQGPKNIGKSTVISRVLEILTAEAPLKLGGFFTWNGGKSDPHVYIRPARSGSEGEIYRLASYDAEKGGLKSNVSAFEHDGVRILNERAGVDLIIMDELGYLESGAPVFRKTVLDTLTGGVPVLGVLRLGNVPWHEEIKRYPAVTIYNVDEKNRGDLPRELTDVLKRSLMNRKK